MGCLQNSGEVVKTPRADMPAGSGHGKTSNDFWNFGVLQMLTTFRVRASRVSASSRKTVNSIDLTIWLHGNRNRRTHKVWRPWRGSGEANCHGKVPLGMWINKGEALECQPYIDLQMLGAPGTEWVWRRMISSVKVLHQFVVRPSRSRVFCLSFDVGVWIFGKLSKPTGFPILQRNNLTPGFSFLNTNATASFLIFKACLQYSYTRSASHCAAFWWMT